MTKPLAVCRFVCLTLLFIILVLPKPAWADIRLPAIFGSHMVLQQDIKIPVWGWADAGEAVTVTLGNHTGKTTADANGQWRIDLDPVATATAPLTLTVTGKNSLTFDDVLVGDVWVCSGQSNMEFGLGELAKWQHDATTTVPATVPPPDNLHDAAAAIAAADDPQIRFFVVQKRISFDAEPDVIGQWEVCTPDSAARFSAIGYFFGRELRHALNHPIGLIGAYWGGQPIEPFISLSGLQKDPHLATYVDAYQKALAARDKAKIDAINGTKNYPAALAAYPAQLEQWNETVAPAYNAALAQWQDAVNQAKAGGQPAPPKPTPSSPKPVMPNPPVIPDENPTKPVGIWPGASALIPSSLAARSLWSTPAVLYNGMIAPLVPYGIKGVIWYQGESNTGYGARDYETLFPRMISDWREKWNEGDFPFLVVQLPNFMEPQIRPVESTGWPKVRDIQSQALALPNTGMAVIIDIGDANNIHPKDKVDVGHRLALVAQHVAYGKDLVYSGPTYDSMKIEGNKIRLTFKNIGSGLQIGTPPWTPDGTPAPMATELTGFAVAGTDKYTWFWAKAQIDGDSVVVSSDQVPAPTAARYGWGSNPPCNLYNKEGLPAAPFRTDDWKDSWQNGPADKRPIPPYPSEWPQRQGPSAPAGSTNAAPTAPTPKSP